MGGELLVLSQNRIKLSSEALNCCHELAVSRDEDAEALVDETAVPRGDAVDEVKRFAVSRGRTAPLPWQNIMCNVCFSLEEKCLL